MLVYYNEKTFAKDRSSKAKTKVQILVVSRSVNTEIIITFVTTVRMNEVQIRIYDSKL